MRGNASFCCTVWFLTGPRLSVSVPCRESCCSSVLLSSLEDIPLLPAPFPSMFCGCKRASGTVVSTSTSTLCLRGYSPANHTVSFFAIWVGDAYNLQTTQLYITLMSISKTIICFYRLGHVAANGRITSYNKSWHIVRCHASIFLKELALKISIKQPCDWLFETYLMWNINDSSVLGCNALSGRAVPDSSEDGSGLIFRVKQSTFYLDCLTLKMKALFSFRTPGNTHPVTQCHNPKDLAPQQHCCKCPASNYDAWWDTMTYAHTFRMGEKRKFVLNLNEKRSWNETTSMIKK